ncbi:methylglyoxal synthase [Kosmotoga arenicorallina S304]|uniref:Methylglyoxal synthase n=1 Tax=Kosmotoga arenicorallina S304 TaxID=1453497 RepID=A0A176K238_9BACT|nr:methylglyoxal synthase [Kosmotoga arenicorallina]OAA31044.1 methylglyoxal synthase [Kosmotoga arenicorallina S304]
MEKPRVALIAHDKKKIDLIMFVKENIETFKFCELYATGTTGKFLREKLSLPVNAVHSGPLGGDIQIGALLVEGKMDFVIFLRDPLTAQPHEPDISALMRVCDVLNIPLATNLATAEALVVEIKSILKSSEL